MAKRGQNGEKWEKVHRCFMQDVGKCTTRFCTIEGDFPPDCILPDWTEPEPTAASGYIQVGEPTPDPPSVTTRASSAPVDDVRVSLSIDAYNRLKERMNELEDQVAGLEMTYEYQQVAIGNLNDVNGELMAERDALKAELDRRVSNRDLYELQIINQKLVEEVEKLQAELQSARYKVLCPSCGESSHHLVNADTEHGPICARCLADLALNLRAELERVKVETPGRDSQPVAEKRPTVVSYQSGSNWVITGGFNEDQAQELVCFCNRLGAWEKLGAAVKTWKESRMAGEILPYWELSMVKALAALDGEKPQEGEE